MTLCRRLAAVHAALDRIEAQLPEMIDGRPVDDIPTEGHPMNASLSRRVDNLAKATAAQDAEPLVLPPGVTPLMSFAAELPVDPEGRPLALAEVELMAPALPALLLEYFATQEG
jgi:hypothetical protein